MTITTDQYLYFLWFVTFLDRLLLTIVFSALKVALKFLFIMKSFDNFDHDIWMAKFDDTGIWFKSLKLIASCLEKRMQKLR